MRPKHPAQAHHLLKGRWIMAEADRVVNAEATKCSHPNCTCYKAEVSLYDGRSGDSNGYYKSKGEAIAAATRHARSKPRR